MKKITLLLILSAIFANTGCARKQEIISTKGMGFGFPDRGKYAKLKDYALSLELSSGSRKFIAGREAEAVFILRNRGKKKIRLQEWFKHDPSNLKLKCQIWMPGSEKPDPDMWLELSVPVKRPAWRYPITLEPGEERFVSSNLDFIRNMQISPGRERRFFIQGELNLTSVDVKSPVHYIVVTPQVMRKKK